jgi:hypothetical protein
MKISRHARNNIRLYKISETDIIEAIKSPDSSGKEGNKLIALKKFQDKFSGYPLKVVYEVTNEDILVITAYPLKKKHWR